MSDSVKSVMMGMQPTVSPSDVRMEHNLSDSSDADREKVCRNFESFMLYSMLKHLEKTTKMTKKGYAEETYLQHYQYYQCLILRNIQEAVP